MLLLALLPIIALELLSAEKNDVNAVFNNTTGWSGPRLTSNPEESNCSVSFCIRIQEKLSIPARSNGF